MEKYFNIYLQYNNKYYKIMYTFSYNLWLKLSFYESGKIDFFVVGFSVSSAFISSLFPLVLY